MNSPTEPASPSPSTPSSGSPPPDEIVLTTHVSHRPAPSPSASKRRLPGGPSFAAASNMRDAKSRRREEALAGNASALRRGGGGWADGKEGPRRDKDDLVDIPLAEQLRKDFGDPFQDAFLKN